jgi:hypothetical protein
MWSTASACVDVAQGGNLSFSGTLTYRIFAGLPNYEDVRHGDAPEPRYILKLDTRICVKGDEFLRPSINIDRIQVSPDEALLKEFRRMVGKRVLIEGRDFLGAHTGHHHAPLMMAASSIKPAPAYGQQTSHNVKDLVSDFERGNTVNVLTNGNRKPYLLQIDVCESKVEAFVGDGQLIDKGAKMIGFPECTLFFAARSSSVGKEILRVCPIGSRCRIESGIVGDSGIPFVVNVERLPMSTP